MTQSESLRSRLLNPNALLLLFAVGIVPNAFFLAASTLFLAERMLAPTLFVLAGLTMIFISPLFGWIAFFVVAAIDLALIISFAFHLPLPMAIDSLKYISSIDVRASLLYVAILAIVITTTTAAAWMTQRHRHRFRTASPLPVVMVALALFAYDRVYTYPYFQAAPAAFDSASTQTGLSGATVAASGKNLLIVMVEGLGAFADPADREIFESVLTKGLPDGRYAYRAGTTAYQGSTTGAAARELCGEWADYLTYIDSGEHDCLPRRLADRGYQTIAYHGFPSQMFERDRWYPKIGFTELHFPDRLLREHGDRLDRRCGSVFHGLCDDQLGSIVHARLLEKPDEPKMVYWLTLNSHVPYVPQDNGKLACRTATPRIDDRTVCELSEIWLKVFDRVNAIAADPAMPPTDILLVGDHHTPLWRRSAKNKFILGEVDWFLLTDLREGLNRPNQVLAAGN